MTSLTMRQLRVDGRPPEDQVNVTVEPSTRLQYWGVYVRVNDHYTADENGQGGSTVLIERLERDFEESMRGSETLIDQVMSLAEAEC